MIRLTSSRRVLQQRNLACDMDELPLVMQQPCVTNTLKHDRLLHSWRHIKRHLVSANSELSRSLSHRMASKSSHDSCHILSACSISTTNASSPAIRPRKASSIWMEAHQAIVSADRRSASTWNDAFMTLSKPTQSGRPCRWSKPSYMRRSITRYQSKTSRDHGFDGGMA